MGAKLGLKDEFPKTRTTLLKRARESGGFQAREDFARLYYSPVLAFLQVKVRDSDLAQELAQEFFGKLSETRAVFEHFEREQGAFRTYLMRSLQNFVLDYYRRKLRVAGRDTHPDQWDEGGWDRVDGPTSPPAEEVFHREWVKATLQAALATVREICARKGQHLHLSLFEARYLSDKDHVPSWPELGSSYGLDQKSARERAETVARHFRIILRRMLRQQMSISSPEGSNRAQQNEAAIDREIDALLSPVKD